MLSNKKTQGMWLSFDWESFKLSCQTAESVLFNN